MTKKTKKTAVRKRTPKEPKPLTAVDLAKDALALIRAKKFVPVLRNYLILQDALTDKHAGESFQKHIQKPKFYCEGCELGALLVAYVDKANYMQVPDRSSRVDSDFIIAKLQAIIPKRQLRFMEAAFEAKDISEKLPPLYAEAAIAFALQFGSVIGSLTDANARKVARKRMVAIMKNVIQNGQFTLPLPVLLDEPEENNGMEGL